MLTKRVMAVVLILFSDRGGRTAKTSSKLHSAWAALQLVSLDLTFAFLSVNETSLARKSVDIVFTPVSGLVSMEVDKNQSPASRKHCTVSHSVSMVVFPRKSLENSGKIEMFTVITTATAVRIGYAICVNVCLETAVAVLVKMVRLTITIKKTNRKSLGVEDRRRP